MFSRKREKEPKKPLIPLPDQVKRLLVAAVIIVAIFVAIRGFFIPDTFGELGHYRRAAIDSIAALDIRYAGHKACNDCHDDMEALKATSYHKKINCESCHGPGEDHVKTEGEVLPEVPRERDHCLLCHVYNPAKPTGFPQIDPVAHNPVKRCIVCHDPHAPVTPETPEECSACHGSIYRTKALSPHAPLNCTECHDTPDDHLNSPRMFQPGKPNSNADCAKCHGRGQKGDRFVPKVDVKTHGEDFFCWECHYPHYPEAK